MKSILSLALALALLFMLTACAAGGNSTAGSAASEEDISYIGGGKGLFRSQSLSLPGNPSVSHIAHAGDSLILGVKSHKGDRLYRFNPDSQTAHELETPEGLSIVSMDSGPDSQVCILNTEADGSYSIYLLKPDESMEMLDIPDCRALEDELPSALFMSSGGYLLNTFGHIVALDSDGSLLREFDCGSRLSGNYVDVVGSGEAEALVLISGEEGTEVWVMDAELQIKEKHSFPESYLDFYSGDGSYIYARDTGIIFRLDYRTGERQALVDTGLSQMYGSAFLPVSEDCIYNNARGVLNKWSPWDGQELEILTLATYGQPIQLSRLVSAFNDSSPDCKIDILDYSVYDNADAPDQGLTRLNLDILSGKGPDIIELSAFYPNFYSSKGLLQDLGPFLESEENLGLNESLLRLLEYNGGIYELVPAYDIYTLCGDESVVGSSGNLSLEQFYRLADAYGLPALLGPGMTRSEFIQWYLVFESSLVDYDRGSCNFTGSDFVKMLELSASLPESTPDNTENLFAELYTGSCLLALTGMSSDPVGTVAYLDTIFSGDARFVGFPTAEGSGTVIEPVLRLGMASGSDSKEQVWDFFSFLLSETVQTDRQLSPGFPAVEDALDIRIQELSEHYQDGKMKLYTSYQDIPIEISGNPADSITREKLIYLSHSIDGFTQPDQAILDIVLFEIEAFYSGAATAREAAERIQSRAGIYLSEQYG